MGNLTGRAAANAEGLSYEDVEKHNTEADAWMILFGEAIDVTNFLPHHPGGSESMQAYLGKDATEAWVEIHTPESLEKNLHLMVKKGKMQPRQGLISWLVQRITAPSSSASNAPATPSTEGQPTETPTTGGPPDDKTKKGLAWVAEEHDKELPEDGVFTVESLKRWDGVNLPMLVGICGLIIDVSPSDNFVPGFGYGKLWAGKDCTWAMATVSLKHYDANKFDFKVEELGELQFKSLCGWLKHFTEKYRKVGTLRELDGWDFSKVEAGAEEMKKAAAAQAAPAA
eukprot:TRINITY_DN55452_c0_g1_i1.p1 TRINITY_DN55452_c0_g1~~TRINITY_DN55452_c0_g1_i1.p1  ORF type:complete len:284 (+),score=67.15 TRINITY_DN55452_c0_g1_i1:22-873(+)